MDGLTWEEIGTIVVLVAGQLVTFRTLQWLAPTTYFRTADLVESQGDVTPKAVLIRLAIPMVGGAVGAWIGASSIVLPIAGFFAWFLISWPAFWLPRFVRGAHQFLTWTLMFAFLVSWTALPIAGAALFDAIANGDKDNLLVQGILLPIVSTTVTGILAAADRPFLAERDRLQLDELHRDSDSLTRHWIEEADDFADDGVVFPTTTVRDVIDRNAVGITALVILGGLVRWAGRRP